MKKWMWGLLIAAVALGGAGVAGYNYLMNQAADRLSQQFASDEDLIKRLEDIEIPRDEAESDGALPDETGTESETDGSNSSASESKPDQASRPGNAEQSSNASESNELRFNSKQEAVKFVMSRFSASEVSELSKLSLSDLTPEEKKELKALAYSRFTSAEIEAVRKAVTN